uniref:Zinc finger CW-type PWWP domain protein 1 n=1 Tax=Chelydra serpentina TaxID=8475 RepID=A0A8C3T7M5_CHESE
SLADESTEANKERRKRHRKGEPKKIVQGYTLIADQEEMEEGGENQCVAWVQCSDPSCEKWRRLSSETDPSVLPEDWTCSQNADLQYKSCDVPEETWSGSENEVVYATYVPGSIIWAKQFGYPWWPAMVECDPDIGEYFLFSSRLDSLPSKYHVTFFGDSVCRAWISATMLRNFHEFSTESLGLVNSGFPEGPALGPVLFSPVVNDLETGVNSEGEKVADDTKLLKIVKSKSKMLTMLGTIRKGLDNKTEDIIMPLSKSMVHPRLEYCAQIWSPHLKKDILELEKMQRRATKMFKAYGTASV